MSMLHVLASVKTRDVFWHFTVWLRVVWYVLAVGSVFVFLYGVARPLVKYRRGHGGAWPPVAWRELPGRLAGGLGRLLPPRTIGRRSRVVGFAHGGIFYGWLVLFAGTIVLGFETDFTAPVFGWHF